MPDIKILLSYLIAKESVQPSSNESLLIVLNELSDASIWKLIESPTATPILKQTCKGILKDRITVSSN